MSDEGRGMEDNTPQSPVRPESPLSPGAIPREVQVRIDSGELKGEDVVRAVRLHEKPADQSSDESSPCGSDEDLDSDNDPSGSDPDNSDVSDEDESCSLSESSSHGSDDGGSDDESEPRPARRARPVPKKRVVDSDDEESAWPAAASGAKPRAAAGSTKAPTAAPKPPAAKAPRKPQAPTQLRPPAAPAARAARPTASSSGSTASVREDPAKAVEWPDGLVQGAESVAKHVPLIQKALRQSEPSSDGVSKLMAEKVASGLDSFQTMDGAAKQASLCNVIKFLIFEEKCAADAASSASEFEQVGRAVVEAQLAKERADTKVREAAARQQ